MIAKIFIVCYLIISCIGNTLSNNWINVFENAPKERTFKIDYNSNGFLKDGEPFRYISGTIPYFRVPPDYWVDRFRKLKHMGANVVQSYVEWNSHESEPGVYNFEGNVDLFKFLYLAYEEGLLVILRPGPYIDAERDMGGLPYWLLKMNPNMKLRTMDPTYIYYVDRWFNVLLPMLRPYLYENGGPVIMLQVENEYGSYFACDYYYTSHLRDLYRKVLGEEVVLFTTDGGSTGFLKCGKVAGVYATVDFGPDSKANESFMAQRIFEPKGPLVNSEFYPGWLDHWGEPHSKRSSEVVANSLDEILAMNASVNIYVVNGGTSFGLTSGSNIMKRFQACPTSYDYDAPLTEAGDPTEKYYAIRNVTQKYVKLPPGPVPGPTDKYAYGAVPLLPETRILEMLELSYTLGSVTNMWPLTFEELSVFNGLVLYSTRIPFMIPDPARLSLFDIHDRGYVYINEVLVGIVSRELELYEIAITARPGDRLAIVVESQGRVGNGDDFKGITTNVTIGFTKLSNWKMMAVPLLNATRLREVMGILRPWFKRNYRPLPGGMIIFNGTFNISDEPNQPQDTFLRLDGWTKGYVWINDFLLGRYWPAVGPQITLYVPRSLLKRQENTIIVLELEKPPCTQEREECYVSFVDVPEIDGPTPQW